MLKVVDEENQSQQHVPAAVGGSLLDKLARDGARQMLAAALLAEVAAYFEEHAGEVDENGHRLVVRNGFHDAREVATAAGAVPVRAPRVNDKRIDDATGERKRFSSAILPAWARKSPGVAEVLPLLYLHGLSSGDFVPALEQFLGSTAGLSAATVTRLASVGVLGVAGASATERARAAPMLLIASHLSGPGVLMRTSDAPRISRCR